MERLLAGEWTEDVVREMGVSRRTAFKWKKRYREEGEAGLEDRSSRPHRIPNRHPRHRRGQIERLRWRRWSTPRIARETGIPLSTVGAECRRLGLGRLPNLKPPVPVVGYEWGRPGELVHLDTKKLARIEVVGHRIHGHRSRTVDGAGWEFLPVCVDDATRVTYAEVVPDEKGATAARFLRRAAAWFERQGVKVERVMSDKGSCYRSKVFRPVGKELQARHFFTRPYIPRTNGKAERFIRTAKELWAYARPYGLSNERRAQLRPFLNFYNCVQPHWGIGRKTPQQRLVELRVTNVLVSNMNDYHTRYEWISCTRVYTPFAEEGDAPPRLGQPGGLPGAHWIFVDALGKYLRVVTLPDGETVHTAFPDRGFEPPDGGGRS